MGQGGGADQQVKELRFSQSSEPFTLVIELDAWNIRERGEHWGCAEKLRAAGQEPGRKNAVGALNIAYRFLVPAVRLSPRKIATVSGFKVFSFGIR